MVDDREPASTTLEHEPAQAVALARALRWIGRHGLGRTSRGGLVGLIVGVETPALRRMLDGEVLEFAMEQTDFDEHELTGGPCLVFDDETFSDPVDDCGPENAFEIFLNNAFIGSYNVLKDEAALVSSRSMWDILSHHIPALYHVPDVRECGLRGTEHRRLEGIADFCGTHAVCEYTDGETVCGEKMCHAEHAWLKDGVCRCYMSSGGFVTEFYLYPFTTTQ